MEKSIRHLNARWNIPFLAKRRMEAAAAGEVLVLQISLGKTLGNLEALRQILSAGDSIISRA